jgi:hypothetical protein
MSIPMDKAEKRLDFIWWASIAIGGYMLGSWLGGKDTLVAAGVAYSFALASASIQALTLALHDRG